MLSYFELILFFAASLLSSFEFSKEIIILLELLC